MSISIEYMYILHTNNVTAWKIYMYYVDRYEHYMSCNYFKKNLLLQKCTRNITLNVDKIIILFVILIENGNFAIKNNLCITKELTYRADNGSCP